MGLFNSVLSGLGVFGGNSGYVGYSKSKRAVAAEKSGLRNKSQMDSSFAEEVNALIIEAGGSPVSLSQIKKSLDDIRSDEWHHTSKFGNKTKYYSANTIAEHFCPAVVDVCVDKWKRELEEKQKRDFETNNKYIRLCELLSAPGGKRYFKTDNPEIFIRLFIYPMSPQEPSITIVKRKNYRYSGDSERDIKMETLLRQYPDANITVLPIFYKIKNDINKAVEAIFQ